MTNGWRNYETWMVVQWLENDPDSEAYWSQVAREADDIDQLAAMLEQDHGAYLQRQGLPRPSLFTDLLDAALAQVDWGEIAAAYWDACRDEDGGGA